MARKRRQTGGANVYGTDVRSISNFTPSQIPDLIFWIQADPATTTQETIQEYADQQSLTLQESLEKQFSTRLHERVITAIKSKAQSTNSLVRLEIDETLPSTFPVYKSYPDKLDTFDVSNLLDPNSKQEQRLKLVSTEELFLPDNFTVYTISHGVKIQYLNSLEKIMVVAEFVQAPTTTIIENTPHAIPTAEFSEIIIYSRPLTQEEDQLVRGYLAYRQNNQYVLESSNPYIPDKTAEPALEPIAKRLSAVEDALDITMKTMAETYTHRVETTGEDAITKQHPAMEKLADQLTENILELKNTLSRGVLAAKEKTIDAIFNIINEKSMSPVPISQSVVDTRLGEFEGRLSKLKQYTASLVAQANPSPITKHKEKIESERTDKQDMQTTEIMNTTKREVEARNLYQALYTTRKSLELYGKSFYNSLHSAAAAAVDSSVDTFEYHFAEAERNYLATMGQFTPLRTSFETGFINSLTGYDTTVVTDAASVTLKGGGKDLSGNFILDNLVQSTPPQTIQYRDPYVNSLQIRFETLRNCILYGDFAYLYQSIERIYAYILDLQSSIVAKDIHPILQPLYLSIYSERFQEFNRLVESFKTLQQAVTDELSDFSSTIAGPASGTATTSSLKNPYEYKDSVKPRYIRRVVETDTILYGIEYVVTDKGGKSKGPFPEFWFPAFAAGEREYATPYFSIGEPVMQTYTEIEPYTESIMDLLEESNKPPIVRLSITGTYVIPVQRMNMMHIVHTDRSEHRVLLPLYGLTPNQSVVVFNSGTVPIPVVIPGTAADYVDVVGPGTGTVYLYGKADDYYYGKVPWIESMIAYDSLLDCPRTSVCAFVEDMKAFIYVYSLKPSRKLYTALLDADGKAIEVKRATDTYVYDVDDAFNSCPYIVSSIGSIDSAALQNRKTLTLREQPEIKVAEETTTRMPILCNSKGVPGINQYGYIRVCQNPIVQIKGLLKTRGAYDDSVLQTIPPITLKSMRVEPYVSFEFLFRPHFALQLGTEFIFATYSTFPIATPSGNSILIDSIKNHGISIVYYDDGSASNNAFVLDGQVDAPAEKKSYPFFDVDAYRNAENHRSIITTSLEHYRSSQAYLAFLLNDLSGNRAILTSFDGEETVNAVQTIDTCNEVILKEKGKIDAMSDSLTSMQANPTILTGNTRITLDTMHVSLTESMESVQDANTMVQTAMQEFSEAIQGIEGIRAQEAILEKRGPEVFKESTAILHAKLQDEIVARGTTGAPDLEVLLKKIVAVQADFSAALGSIKVSIEEQPKYMNDIRSWLKDIWSRLGDAAILLQTAEQIINVELDQAIQAYKRKEDGYLLYSKLQEVDASYKQLVSKRMAAETSMEHLKSTLKEDDPIHGAYREVEGAFDNTVDTDLRELKTSVLDGSTEKMTAAIEKIRTALLPMTNALDTFSAALANASSNP